MGVFEGLLKAAGEGDMIGVRGDYVSKQPIVPVYEQAKAIGGLCFLVKKRLFKKGFYFLNGLNTFS
jgi:hypothetical protein